MTCLEKLKQLRPELDDEGIKRLVEDQCPDEFGIMSTPDYCDPYMNCDKCWDRKIPETEPKPSSTHDPVNHPNHYCREGGMESIDEMLLVFGKEATMHFCLLNAWKYRYRAADKNGAEDIAKSDWYIAKYAKLKGGD